MKPYVAIIERAKTGYGVFFPDIPGRTSAGATIHEAAANAARETHQSHNHLTPGI